MQKPMSNRSEITAALNAAREAEARLIVSVRHTEKIGALPPNLMSAKRDLYEARRLVASAITNLEKSMMGCG